MSFRWPPERYRPDCSKSRRAAAGYRPAHRDPDTGRVRGANQVGEIWVADPSVAAGYWRKPEDSAATFQARLSDDRMAGPFLRTGDLGFIQDGRTPRYRPSQGPRHHRAGSIITRRISSGRSSGIRPEVRRDHCVAFAVTRRTAKDSLVIFGGAGAATEDWNPLFLRIRGIVAEHHGLPADAIVVMKRGGILKTSSGKLQRRACREAFLGGKLNELAFWRSPDPADRAASPGPVGMRRSSAKSGAGFATTSAMRWGSIRRRSIMTVVRRVRAGLPARKALFGGLEAWLGIGELDPALLWRHPSVSALGSRLAASGMIPEKGVADGVAVAEPIAIIGMACRFPGGPNPEAFWSLLRQGRSGIGPCPRMPGVEGGFLDQVDGFDAAFFGISAAKPAPWTRSSACCWRWPGRRWRTPGMAPGRPGRQPRPASSSASAPTTTSQLFSRPDAGRADRRLLRHRQRLQHRRRPPVLPARAAQGPSLAVDTACSSSLVAVHLACQSLRSGECDMALAGGVNLILAPEIYIWRCRRRACWRPDGRCKTFDAAADGYVRGEGCGVVVLKRLADAQARRRPRSSR